MTEKVRLASIGLGWWANVLADAVGRSDTAEIVSCFTRNEEARQAFAAKRGCRAAASVQDLLGDGEVEGVLVTTPHSHHPEIISLAASAGKHIFVEKPMTLTVPSARRAVEETDEAGVVLMVGHQRRRQSANRRVKQMIDEGELGVLHQLEASLGNAVGTNTNWRGDPEERPLGGLTAMGVHMIDTLLYWAGPIRRVFCWSKQITGRDKLDDAAVSLVEFENEALGYVTFSLVTPKIATAVALGDAAAAWSEEDGSRLFVEKAGETTRTELEVEAGDPFVEEIDEFARAIRGEAVPETGGRESLAVVEVMVAMIESARSGKPVDLEEVR